MKNITFYLPIVFLIISAISIAAVIILQKQKRTFVLLKNKSFDKFCEIFYITNSDAVDFFCMKKYDWVEIGACCSKAINIHAKRKKDFSYLTCVETAIELLEKNDKIVMNDTIEHMVKYVILCYLTGIKNETEKQELKEKEIEGHMVGV